MSEHAIAAPSGAKDGLIAELHSRQPVLAWAGWVMFAGLVASLLASGFDERTLNGIDIWTKPAKFYAAAALYLWTFGWFFGALSPQARRSRTAMVVVWGAVLSMAVELLLISGQAARGVASHFNDTTAFDATVYTVMGVFAVLATIYGGMLAWLVWRRPASDVPLVYRRAIVIGLVGFILGGIEGGYLGSQAGHWVGGTPSDAEGLPIVGWSRDGGDLRIAHFFGIHAMQVIPFAGFLIAAFVKRPAEQVRTGLLMLVSLAYLAVMGWTFTQALSGQPLV